METVYKDELRLLLTLCDEYRKGQVCLEEFKQGVWSAASSIVNSQESDFRRWLQAAEGRLDIIQFTVDMEKIYEATLSVVEEIEREVIRRL